MVKIENGVLVDGGLMIPTKRRDDNLRSPPPPQIGSSRQATPNGIHTFPST